ISLTLYYIVRRVRRVPFSWMYLAFGAFIIACGGTHFSDVVTVWHPIYWFDGGLRVLTAIASVGTALFLIPLAPKALAFAQSAQLGQERGLRLEEAHRQLTEAHEKTLEIERLKTQFFANVSHELRTPLALILGPTEKLLAADVPSPTWREDLNVVR